MLPTLTHIAQAKLMNIPVLLGLTEPKPHHQGTDSTSLMIFMRVNTSQTSHRTADSTQSWSWLPHRAVWNGHYLFI